MPGPLTYETLVAQLDSISPPGDPADPKTKTRARILRTAKALFEERGYRRTSIDEVARDSGIAKGTVYVHFKSKAELLLHVMVQEKKRLLGPFREVFTGDLEPAARLRRYLELLFLSLADSPLSTRLLTGDRELLHFMEELPAELRARLLAQQGAGVAALLQGVGDLDQLSEAERAERVKAFSGLMASAGHLVAAGAHTGLEVLQYARQVAKILVNGVGAR